MHHITTDRATEFSSNGYDDLASPRQVRALTFPQRTSRAACTGLLVNAALAGWASTASAGSVTFDYTGSAGSWTVPAGVTSIDVVAVGGGGGGGSANELNPGAPGGAGAIVSLTDVAVASGSTLAYFVGGGGSSSDFTFIEPFPNVSATIWGGGGGGGSTNLGSLGGQPWLIAAGGGGGSGGGSGASLSFITGGEGCGVTTGGGGSSPLSNRAGGSGGVGGDYAMLNSIAGGSGNGGSGGSGGGFEALGTTGAGYGGSGGGGNGSGTGGNGSHQAIPATDPGAGIVTHYRIAGGGGGGGYGGGGATALFGGGAGGSLWPEMTPTTDNSPTCVPASNGGAPSTAGGNGSLTITWVDVASPTPPAEAVAVPALRPWAVALLGLVAGAVGLLRLRLIDR